jgi:predicted nucleic acid-binding protein
MRDKIQRIYVDASVASAMFDTNEHPEKTRAFWQAVISREVRIIASDILTGEVNNAPKHVQDFFDSLPKSQIERIVSTDESNELAKRYIVEGIVSNNNLNDCKHVALATLAEADVLVSWNFRHIVKLNKIYRYNAINKLLGYREIEIRTPNEVIYDET